MKKNVCAIIQKLLKIGLLSYIILLFSFIGLQGENTKTSYAMSSNSLQALAPLDTTTPAATDTSTPTPTPTPKPTPAPTQQPMQAPPPPVGPTPTTIMPIDNTTTQVPATATPDATPQSVTPTTVATPAPAKTKVPIPTPPHLQNTGDNGLDAFTLSLALGVAAPSVMIGGGTLWLLVKWQIKRHRLALEEAAQASPWVSSHDMQASFQALQAASGAALNTTMPTNNASGAFPVSTLPAQPTYTASDLRPITTAFPPQTSTMNSNGGANYALNGDLQPLPISSLDLSLEVTRAIESNGNGYMPPLLDTPTGLVDTPTSHMPSSPPLSGSLPTLSLNIQPPTLKDDLTLASVMRQAQMGLFALPGREESLVH